MYRTSYASRLHDAEIIGFLENRGLVENAWLISQVSLALHATDKCWSVVICRRGEELAGVACVLHRSGIVGTKLTPQVGQDYEARMDADDRKVVELLAEALPRDRLGYLRLYRPAVQEYFEALPDVLRHRVDFCFTVSADHFRPAAGDAVTELTPSDAGLFEGCEVQRHLEQPGEHYRVFAIIRNGRVATSASTGNITVGAGTERQVVIVAGLYTETRYRRLGLAKRLVSHITEMILRDGNAPMYWTREDNTASQGVATGLGYRQFGTEISYLWGKIQNAPFPDHDHF